MGELGLGRDGQITLKIVIPESAERLSGTQGSRKARASSLGPGQPPRGFRDDNLRGGLSAYSHPFLLNRQYSHPITPAMTIITAG
jgi:hypothetical protein